jgi:hypothetical protein
MTPRLALATEVRSDRRGHPSQWHPPDVATADQSDGWQGLPPEAVEGESEVAYVLQLVGGFSRNSEGWAGGTARESLAAWLVRPKPTERATRVPATADVADVLATVVPRVAAWLARRSEPADADPGADAWTEDAPALAVGLAAASVQGRAALGDAAGRRARRLGRIDGGVDAPGPADCQARQDGFDRHAGVRLGAGQRERLEQVCQYMLRPPIAQDRLAVTDAGHVRLTLRHPWADGTTHLEFDPVAFLERLAVLVPRPRVNLMLYHGVLAPRAAWRSAIVPRRAAPGGRATGGEGTGGWPWAALMRRTFGFDVLACSRFGGRLRLIAVIEQPAVIQRILRHLGLPDVVPAARPPRAPPLAEAVDSGTSYRLATDC